MVKCNEKFEATRYEQPIDILLCVSFTLGDNLLAGLSGIQTQRFCEITRMNSKKVCEMLKKESPDLYFSYLLSLLREEINGFTDEKKETREYIVNYRVINKIIEIIIHDEKIYSVNSDTLLNIFEVFEYCLIRKMVFLSTRKELIKILPHLLDDSKLALKKINRSPEIVSGIRIMQLLVKNTGFLLLDRYDEPIFRNSFISGEWSEEIERFMHLTSRYTKNNIYFLETYEDSNIYEMSLLNIIDRMPALSKRERERVLEPFLTMNSIEVLIETNPELLSRIVLSLLKNSDIRRKEMDSVIEVFLRGCLNHLEDIGIGYLEFNTIINSISIACYIDATWFLNEIRSVLHYQLFGRHPRFFMSIIYLYPQFVADLIDVMPEIFDKFFPSIFEPRFIEKEFRYAKPEKWLDYIKIFRFFYQLFYRESHKKEDIPRELHKFSQMILEFNKFREIDFAKLTISQIEDLMWYADFTNDEHISTKIKETLQRYLYI